MVVEKEKDEEATIETNGANSSAAAASVIAMAATCSNRGR